MNNKPTFVYKFLTQISLGKVMIYDQISVNLGINSICLVVGRFLHNNPDLEKYPGHRVVFSDGSLVPKYTFSG